MILPIGPIHPYLKEPIRLKLQTEGERVVKLFPLSPTVATFELSTE